MRTKKEYRQLDVCVGCGKPKEPGLLVCWDCFKYREDIWPLKQFVESGKGTFWDWLKTIPQTWKTRIAAG